MGWFDDDDDDESEEEVVKLPPPVSKEEEEEEDPLDAYMNTLDTNATTKSKNIGIRLDVVNEEEATSHWKKQPNNNTNNNNDDKESMDNNELSLTFHKAGQSTNQNNEEEEEEEEDFDWTNQNYSHKQKKKTTIAPLQVSNTTSIEYEPIQKCILHDFKQQNPKDDEQTWRKKRSVQLKSLSSSNYHHQYYTCSYMTKQELQKLQPQNDPMLNSIQELTPVQSQAIPILLQGKDVIVTSKTGSGKTFTYVWPLKLHLQTNPNHIALILVPTRELAQQVAKNTSSSSTSSSRKKKEVLIMTGGSSWNKEQSTYELIKQYKAYKPNIWVATPGRLIQMVQSKYFDLHKISFLVLDEADKMLDMGFESQVSSILQNLNPQRQTCMMSATFHNKLEQTARKWLQSPIRVMVGKTGSSSEHVQQHVFIVPSLEAKKLWMKEMLPTFVPLGRTLIFCATKQMCNTLADYIHKDQTQRVAVIHGDCHQSDRYKAIQQFAKQRIDALIASDVAARGLDIDNVRTVINFEIPKNYDAYIHRIGRAGRMNTKTNEATVGTAYNLFDSTQKKDVDFANTLLNALTREGKTDTITEEWRNLAMRSNHYYSGTAKKQHKFAGLGFTDPTDNSGGETRYGGSSSRPNKRSRWGS